MAEKKRIVLIDYIKAVCVIFVIVTHSDFFNDAMLDKNGLFYLLLVNKAVPVFMFLSGFVFALSAKDKISQHYAPRKILGKVLRLTIPTLIAYIVFIGIKAASGEAMGVYEIVKRFIAGDYGKGAYYYSIMMQFVFIAPLMYYLVNRFLEKGLVLIGVVNLVYESMWTILDLPDGVYRILVLRYLLVASFGMYIAIKRNQKINNWAVGLMAVVGLVYILLPYFTNYEYKVFTVDPWNKSAMMCSFYVVAVMYVLFAFAGNIKQKGIAGKLFSLTGEASYHIMYTQMMYFVIRPAIDTRIFDITALPLSSQYVVDIVVSVSLGLVFCMIDNKIFGKIYKTK